VRSSHLNSQIKLKAILLAGLLASSSVIPAALTRAAQSEENPGATLPAITSAAASPAPSPATPSFISRELSPRAALTYKRLWGVEDLRVRETASGALLRFSYRVVDATKAEALNSKKANPYLIVPKTGAKLEVPTTEKVGQLRQTATPENGREYWMVFTNLGRRVNAGDKVDIEIGTFRASGLVVELPLPTPRIQKP
jgi:hypothetical protein